MSTEYNGWVASIR